MIGGRSHAQIPLPKRWPSRVRSTVLHAISVAHFSLTHTRSWAANSWNARIRLRQENDRLQKELALIREEMPMLVFSQKIHRIQRLKYRTELLRIRLKPILIRFKTLYSWTIS